jgi:hypothetical protein
MIVLSGVMAMAGIVGAQAPVLPVFGAPSSGLVIGISQDPARGFEPTALEVHFRNVGEAAFMLNLGAMLDTGKVMEPRFLSLTITDAFGSIRTLHWARPFFVAGRMDDYPVALRAGASYSLPINTTDFRDDQSADRVLRLRPGRYRIEVLFQGRGSHAKGTNMEPLPWWVGKAVSGSVDVQIRR